MLEKQSPADAIAYLKKAHELDSHNPEGQFNLARANYKLGRYDEAWALLEPHMVDYEQEPAVAKLLGQVWLAMNQPINANRSCSLPRKIIPTIGIRFSPLPKS